MAASSTGEISIEYKDDFSYNSQITERAANKSPEVISPRYAAQNEMVRSVSNVSGGAASNVSGLGSNASSGSMHSANSGVIRESTSTRGNGIGPTTREANYEEGASELFLLVEGANWQEAITRLVFCCSVELLWWFATNALVNFA